MANLKCFSYPGKAIPPSCNKILSSLATEGAAHKYRLARRIGLSDSRVYDCMEILEGLELVKGRKTGTARTGRPIRKYTLTTKGLVYVFRINPSTRDSAEMMDNIALRHKHLLPPVFGKWSYFERSGVKDIALWSFARTMDNPPYVTYHVHGVGEKPLIIPFESDENVQEKIAVSFYLLPLSWRIPHHGPHSWVWTRDKLRAWLKMLGSDKEIASLVIGFCSQDRKEHSQVINGEEKLQNAIERRNPKLVINDMPFGFLFTEILRLREKNNERR